jgi:hypothetical protein
MNPMTGEHPLDRRFREEDARAAEVANAERAEQRRLDEVRARAATEWPKDETELAEAIAQCNARMEARDRSLRYSYHPEPQSWDDLYRAHVLLSNQETGAHTRLQIRVATHGAVAVALQSGPHLGSFAVGHTTVASWNEFLTRLYDVYNG